MSKPTTDQAMRRAMRSGKIEPSHSGFTTAGLLLSGYAVREQCRGHIWITKKPIQSDKWQSGWKQRATCIVCDFTSEFLDASWWVRAATSREIRHAMRLVKQEGQRLREVYDILKGLME